MAEKKKKKDEEEEDLRLEFIFNYLSKSYKLKQEKWMKMLFTDEYSKHLMNFLNKPTEMKMFMTVNAAGVLCCYRDFNSLIKSKYTFFQKKEPEIVNMDNIRSNIMMGDMAGKPMDELSVLLSSVCLPVLSNPANQQGWPKVVAEDVVQHIRNFKNTVDQIRGAMKSQTVLPLPEGYSTVHLAVNALTSSSDESCDLVLKSNIEAAVIKWASICREVLKQSSKAAFAGGANPTPSKEIEFWYNRLKNLEYIYDQLRDPRVKKMGEYLELTRSTYSKTFKTLFTNIVAGVVEARDINIYLKPLIPHIQRFEESDFLENENYIKPLIHCVGLIWAHSRYYAFSEKIVVLFKEIGNMLIEACTRELDPSSIFQGEPEEIFEKVDKSIQLLELFMNSFEYVRQNLSNFYTNPDIEPQPWTFHRRTVFQRLLLFTDRLRLIRTILSTNMEFTKLEKVEFGGVKGRLLSVKCESAFEDFNRIYLVFSNVQYDVLDIEDNHIYDDYEIFVEKCADLDFRLLAIFTQAFDDCHSLESLFKLKNIIGNLTERPSIREEFCAKYQVIAELLDQEVDTVKIIFDESLAKGIPISNYHPPVAGSILWFQSLKERILKPTEDFKALDHPILESAEALYTLKKIDQMVGLLEDKQASIFNTWVSELPANIEEHMSKFQIIRDEEMGDLFLNFSDELVAMLREMKYLKTIQNLTLPEEAIELFEKMESLYQSMIKLKRIVEYYNHLKNNCRQVEFDIIRDEMANIDIMLEPAISQYNWYGNDVDIVDKMYKTVKALYDRVAQAQDNINQLSLSMQKWCKVPLYERKEGKKEHLLYTEDRPDRLRMRYAAIKQNSEDLKNVLNENYNLYFNIPPPLPPSEDAEKVDGQPPTTPDKKDEKPKAKAKKAKKKKKKGKKKKSPRGDSSGGETDREAGPTDLSYKWEPYVQYVDEIVKDILLLAVKNSQVFFLEEMGDLPNVTPFLEIVVELHPPNIGFDPRLEEAPPSFLSNIEMLLEDMYNMGHHMESADPSERSDYYPDLVDDYLCKNNYTDITSRIRMGMKKAKEYIAVYEDYEPLWTEDRQEFLKEFLLYSKQLTNEERDLLADENAVPPAQKEPTIEQFKQQIDYYDELYKKMEATPTEKILEGGWLRLDLRPVRQGILNTIRKWGNLFKDHLYNHVIQSLDELDQFIKEAIGAMTASIAEDDYAGLLHIMGYLFKVKERMAATDEMFAPLKGIMELLQSYGVEFSEEVYVQLQEIPDRWTQCKKVAATTKQNVAPIQAIQVCSIKRRIQLYEIEQTLYKNSFKDLPFFNYKCENVYSILDKVNKELVAFEEELAELQKQAELFEIQISEFKLTKQLRKVVRHVKQIWDYVFIVRSCMTEWKKTPWKKIDVEAMEMECKRFAKELRAMDKELRLWDVFIQTEASIKNLLTSLRAVTELQNPAIRERHWQQLMQATKVRFVMDESTTLKDLLDLNLHNYEEEVKNIVDKSVKEMGMEKVLKELDATWSVMEFALETHERTKLQVISISEELIETLEENQVALQNMMSSRYIDFFLDEVSDWQNKLSNADQVINAFIEVQRKWMYLESIFIGSEDIRNQLPEDSRRFDKIDKEFREILKTMTQNLNVVSATNVPGLYERLEALLDQLTLCEKALNDYLETKRLAFPRFYFVSSADLLDILSNGNQPELIMRHMTKLFDSLARLTFITESGKTTKKAKEMISKEKEMVKLSYICDCTGKVESWLNKVIDVMRVTLHGSFSEAVNSYEEKPRELWVFDYPAQPALCGTQIWWTTEVNMAFARLEEGYENALKDYQKKQISQLSALINLLLGDLSAGDRQKIMTICTIDVHSRDVVFKLISAKVENSQAFHWQSQLRHRWDEGMKDCFANICDAQFRYQYEYLGNTPRLVITPLTDRCYITLTQSLHLIMGGAPAGPAGTGKTETTKDLGKALGMMVYVFNCSEQMDYKSIGNIFKGLAQTGCWGCFDEFNRISIEVLSVVAVQVKTIQDAIKDKKRRFKFLGDDILLTPTVGYFITMNPGYAGRTELPENLKSLFRPCAMVVPDFELICEIMLVAEGFQEARLLARKFITLYTLCRELLSKQDHYDWGLRAIKSVLVVAGSLKRGDRQRPEDQVLMRALRDFNIPKIITDDVPVFMGLIGDLFPALDVPRKRIPEFEKLIKISAVDLKLQPEDGFTLKVVQLEELFAVRHSVFIIGFAGTGKSMVWKTLNRTYFNQKRKPYYNDLNPKAVTNDELFGIINPATREWKDGLFSVIMRDMANLSGEGPKWIVLDGDIDPMWIESLNTLMDDNKVLTLASNERIALTPPMRLLFEIANLRTATPATVSRAGILYINPADLGWNPYVASWIDTRTIQSEKANLTILFDKYVPPCLEMVRARVKKITPISEIAHLQMLCYLLDCFLIPSNVPPDSPKDWYEIYFVFSTIWAFGSSLFQDQIIDWRNEFSKWFTNEFRAVKFPLQGNVFSYYIDNETKKFLPWTDLVENFELDPDIPLQSTLVNTAETTRIRFFLDKLIVMKVPVMLVGPTGSGKTVLINSKLESLDDNYAVTKVPFNFYTTSQMLQDILEKPLEKKAGRVYGPQGGKTMVYFIDDMNMPEVDKYFTVQPHTLIKQYMDYQHWYDRQKLSLKDIHNVQFISSMNPTAGSFTIDPRLQRHFCVFAVSFPSQEAAFHIYSNIIEQHFTASSNKFPNAVIKLAHTIAQAALALHQRMGQTFLPTAIKFHYTFTLRDMSNICQGMLFTTGDSIKTQNDIIRLWMHEAYRVYEDKLVEKSDRDTYNKIMTEVVKKGFEDLDEMAVFEKPLIYCHFAEGIGDPKYFPINDFEHLSLLLNDALANYNDLVAAMNLVLFEDAMYHICRINRIMESPRGNALLVGVGGSGKQSLSRLAAFISSFEVFQIQLRKGYSMNDMKVDIAGLYLKAGLKSIGIVFLMSDAQVPHESYLVLINDMLASGEISDLLPDEDVENVVNALRNEVKGIGLQDTKENCWRFFIDRVRRLLKTILCFSPVGSTLRIRARKFPALVNCSSIDWFHEWPQEALKSVSKRFLAEIEVLPSELVDSVSNFMSYVHTVVNDMSSVYLANEKRYNYTTPKSFLEQIALYQKLLTEKTNYVNENIERLENGLTKLASTSEEVDGLKEILAVKDQEVAVKNEAATKLIAILAVENEKVASEQAIASEEEARVREIEEDVSVKAKICAEDLAKAEPALIAAMEALNTLNKNNLTELKSFTQPPEAVVSVCAAVLVLFSKKGKIPKERGWKECKMLMGKVDQFMNDLVNYDKENMQPEVVKVVQEYVKNPEFDPAKIISKSSAAAGLCSWVINILKFYDVFVVVEPKRIALAKANQDLRDAQAKLHDLNEKLEQLEAQLSTLKAEFDEATEAKMKVQAEADACALMIDLANRLVNGLASEKIRWRELVVSYHKSIITLPGDILSVTSFISYVGCFTRKYRSDMYNKYWTPFLNKLDPPVPKTEGLDPLSLLTDDAIIAQWNNDGLPTDRMSTENACILTFSARWPLMIDPQLQGIKWIKTKYGDSLTVVRLNMKNYLDILERCIVNGQVILFENIGETLDAVLEPVLGRVLIKKGKAIKIGDKDIDFDPKFRLIMHTKLANPHYKPEIQAQTTLINFTVTRDGLEEQLLAEVVKSERPDLEQLKSSLTKQQNDFKITLKRCEDNLLYRLSTATGNILGDVELVENLETTKKTATEIELKVEEAKITSVKIDEAREQYRPCSARASILYFVLNDLNKINSMYQFSLKAFSIVFKDALARAVPAENLHDRVISLLDSITFSVFMYTSRGLFECDKLTFLAQMTFQILASINDMVPDELDFLLRFPIVPNLSSPVDFLSNISWGGIKALSTMDEFRNLDKDLEGSAKRWKKFVDSECPEKEKFPGEWKNKSFLQRLCLMRALRPDRMTYAIRTFIEFKLGLKYITARSVEFEKSYEETSSATPTFFILSPGVNPLKDVEKLGKNLDLLSTTAHFIVFH
ncbi:hypothetical protein WA026_017536 [Henosepilachna vigintioctopunctata]|uniref:AAA+ ATPase domain-containing protein n=1 Tax=Henosepilachna vigintioctopunctata TaxID=420089 RepID=A0AAW1V0D3_9CUCU